MTIEDLNTKTTFVGNSGCLGTLLKVFIVLILGYYTFFYPLMEYDRTFVDWRIPVIAGCIVGLIIASIFTRQVGRFLGLALIAAFDFNAVLFFLNDTFSDGKMLEIKLRIEAKYPKYGKYGPNAQVQYHDKKLFINATSNEALKAANYAMLKVDKGLFGYEIIRAEWLVKE